MDTLSANGVGTNTSTTKYFFKSQGILWLLLAVGLIITTAATLYMKSTVEKVAEKDFSIHCSEIQNKIMERMENHARILMGGAAFFNVSDTVTRDKWRLYTQYQKIEKQLPGIQGIGFSLLIPRSELPKHINEIRNQGFPEYKVWPDGDRELYSSIVYLEPFSDRNLRAFGYDMLTEPVRLAALERARDTNNATLTGKVVLVQETGKDVQAGTLMFVPIYRKGMPIETVEQRRAAIFGWVYSPYRMNDLMLGILGVRNSEMAKRLHLQIFDGEEPSPESILYSCHPTDNPKLFPDVQYSKLVPVDFNGKRWTLRFTQTGGGFSSIEYISVWLTLGSGILITLLLCFLVRTLLNTRAEAQRIAEKLTVDIARLSNEQQIILNTMPIGVSFLKERKVLMANPAHDQIFGYDVGETVGMNTEALYSDSEIYERIGKEGYTVISSGATYTTEAEMKKKDGALISCRLTGRAANVNKLEDGSIWMIQDITCLKRAEETERRCSLKFKSIIEASPVPKALNDENMNVTLLNPAFIRTFGYTLEDIPTLEKWWTKAYPDYEYRQYVVDAWNTRVEKVKTDGGTFEPLEANIRCKDGTYKTVIANAAPLGESFAGEHLIILFDITDRIKMEEELRDSKTFVDSIIDQSPISMWISDDKGTLVRANQALLKHLNLSDNEIVGIYNLFDDPIIEEQGYMPQVRDVFAKGCTARFTIVYDTSRVTALSLENTSQSVLDVTISPVLDSVGKVTNAIIQHLDITELKQLEENLRKAKLAAESASTVKSQFLANMSHEIRTPMNGVLGMTQLLEMTELTTDQREYVEALKQSGKNLLSLISDILDLSKIEAGKIVVESAEFSLHHCINDVVLMQKSVAFEKNLTLDLKLSEAIPPLLIGDQLRIKQILLNLLGNAVKFTAEGHIALSAKLLEQHDDFALVQIAVRDSGIGISPEYLDTIFIPFTQEDGSTSRKYGGTGLGLTISLRLAELMGGTIGVESTQGVGSCFTVTLPFTVGRDTSSQAAASKTTIGWGGSPLRILFVEDDQVNIKFGSSLLKMMGHDVTVVENGKECLTALEQSTFDLILMDIQMPVMNGEEALREIRTKEQGTTNHQPVIALTAYSMRGDMERFLKEGFDGYVSKPLITRELIGEMKRVTGL